MDVIQQKYVSEGSGDFGKTLDDEVQVIQRATVDGATRRAEMRVYGETPGEGTPTQARRQKLLDNFRDPLGIIGAEERSEHCRMITSVRSEQRRR
jgi:hypothetical protein